MSERVEGRRRGLSQDSFADECKVAVASAAYESETGSEVQNDDDVLWSAAESDQKVKCEK